MKRSAQRRMEEFKEKRGRTYSSVVTELRNTIYKKNARIKQLSERLGTIKQEHEKYIHKLKVENKRELKKLNTKYNNLENKFSDFKNKKGERNRTVFYRNRYKTYESPTAIKRFESSIEDIRTLPEDYLISFERMMKLQNFLEKYNTENDTNIQVNQYLVLLNLLFVKSNVQGITAPKLIIPMLSQHIIRKTLKDLTVLGLVSQVSRISYRISLLGERFLNDARNFNSYGKNETVEFIKRVTRLQDDDETDNI